ncbi:MAG: DNA repair protein RecO [Alphaproteobacteria bacterium CG_4_10_14_0_8_um_filter_53_9]|nr:MAG: DNA repair protein RecO [Alphaproteobacteria bacterium CG_4_10_14_0_8_um_filter_53_9]
MTQSPPDEGVVLRLKPLGERAGGVVTLFTHENGLMRGMVRVSKKATADMLSGNIVRVERWRRLDNQLGSLTLELLSSSAALVMREDGVGALLVGYFAEILTVLMPEEHAYPVIYEAVLRMLADCPRDMTALGRDVAEFERLVLQEVGYGLALGEDAVREGVDDVLVWVSPNTGRAVGALAGEPYADKLLPLPAVWAGQAADWTGEADEVAKALRVTGHFLYRACGQDVVSRERLVARILRL